jgi:hypothetical protein
MIYKFKSKAAGDLIMMSTNGDEVLRLMGKEPAAQGIISVSVMADCIAALEKAIHADEAQHAQIEKDDAASMQDTITLRQRTWPMIDMMKRCMLDHADIVWGV